MFTEFDNTDNNWQYTAHTVILITDTKERYVSDKFYIVDFRFSFSFGQNKVLNTASVTHC